MPRALAADMGNVPPLWRIPPRGGRVGEVMQLYLDRDGVLADFDAGATREYHRPHGPARFWAALARVPDFYGQLPLLPNAMALFGAVRPLEPVILTGCPRGTWAQPQKHRWAAEHFPGSRLITCLASTSAATAVRATCSSTTRRPTAPSRRRQAVTSSCIAPPAPR